MDLQESDSSDDKGSSSSKQKLKKRRKFGRVRDASKRLRLHSHETGEPSKCRKRCFDVLSDESKKRIIKNMNDFISHDEINLYLSGLITVVPVQRKRLRKDEEEANLVQMEWWDGMVLNNNGTCAKLRPKCLQLLGMHALSGCDTTLYPLANEGCSAGGVDQDKSEDKDQDDDVDSLILLRINIIISIAIRMNLLNLITWMMRGTHPNTVTHNNPSRGWNCQGLKLHMCEPFRRWRITFNGLLSLETLSPVARLSLLSHLSSLALHSARWNVPHRLAMRGGPSLVTVQGWLEHGIARYKSFWDDWCFRGLR
uniref:Uncharacterized protein n=1 Tax=Timema genevievae TaxID=629358 RepID=A0A7R9K6M0_TIMGE|nr:unnamed protein product [Timema genevievae]